MNKQPRTARRDNRERAFRFLNDWYPCTTLLFGDGIDCVVERFCDETAEGRVDPAADAACWLRLLRSGIARQHDLLPYTEDVAAYEGAIAALATSNDARRDAAFVSERNATLGELPGAGLHDLVPVVGRHVQVRSYGFDTPAIVTAIEDCDRLEPVAQPTGRTILFVGWPDESRPRSHLISDGVRMLLSLCDGSRDCATIVRNLRATTASDDGAGFERKVLDALEALRAKNVLTYREPADAGGSEP